MALTRTVSEINGDICKIFPPLVFNALAWSFETAVGLEKDQTDIRIRPSKSITIDTSLDEQTDGENWKTISRFTSLYALR